MQTNKYNSRDIGTKFDVTMDSKPVQNEAANLPPTIVADIPMVHMLFLMFPSQHACFHLGVFVLHKLYMSCIQDQVG